jgi:secreted Zn-dependent insulinase-like peptidase
VYLPKSTERNLVVDTLSNQLKLALIRSESTSQPILSISVGIGHYHETDQCYGFSHLLEHMIFNRSKHFSDPDKLEHWISQHGGYINGWTHSNHTNFHLSCSSAGFIRAVRILCDKIAHPSFALDDIKSEIRAIDEEFHLKKSDPVRGLFSVKKALVNPEHPFHRFTVGNSETLSSQTTEALQHQLQQHHIKYFHSGNITACLSLPKDGDFDDLIAQVKSILSDSIKLGHERAKLVSVPLYTDDFSAKWIDVNAKHGHKQLILCWQIKKSSEQLDTSAFLMLRKLIESKHKGGLVAALKAEGWLQSLSLTGGIEQHAFEEIQLHLTLTDEGAVAKSDVIATVVGFLSTLKQSQIASWRFQEQERQQQLLTRYAAKEDAVETCILNAQLLHNARDEDEHRLSVNQVKQRIADIIGQLRWPCHHVYFINNETKVNDHSDFYHVGYKVSDIEATLKPVRQHFILAPQNPYLPSQLLTVSQELAPDELDISERHGVLMKFLQRGNDDQPCGDCFISINSPDMSETLAQTMSKKLWIEGLSHYLTSQFYNAEEAGVSFRIYGHQHGLTLHTTGFSERQLLLCIEIINCIIKYVLSQAEFEQAKRACLKRLNNSLLQKPINQLFASLNTLIQEETYDVAQQLSAIDSLSFELATQLQSEFFNCVCVEALVVGNWRLYAVQRLHQQLQSRLTSKRVWQKPEIKAKTFEQASMPKLGPIASDETALVYYQQVSKLSNDFLYTREHATAVCLVLEHILSPHMFVALRKQKQLAYLVGVGFKPINMQPGIAIYLQSSQAGARDIYAAIIEVIEGLLLNWEDTLEEIQQSKQEVAKQCVPYDRDIASLARRLWANYDRNDPLYNFVTQQKAINNVEDEELKKWLIRLMTPYEGQVLLTNDESALQDKAFDRFIKI